jgi:hypothetical protein
MQTKPHSHFRDTARLWADRVIIAVAGLTMSYFIVDIIRMLRMIGYGS